MSPRTKARLLVFAASLLGRLPWPWLYRLGDGVAALWLRRNARESRVTRINLELAFPQLPVAEREALHRRILRTTARQALETLKLWTQPTTRNLSLLREVHGGGLYDQALAAGRGVIVAAPHFGNWELLNQWLASRGPVAIVYRPPDSEVGDEFLQQVRGVDNVRQVRAEGPAVRQLWKALKEGGAVGILPDQQPKAGDGEFAPFFGVQALTMTLLSRLAERTGSPVLLAWCERIGDGPGFVLHIEQAPGQIADADPRLAVACLNREVERIARRDPSQYQWTYKRYTLRPPGSGEVNPYEEREWAQRPA
ncbi:lauroyl acyltransferase [Pseudoxanthomonas koreensis]|uniref:lauroyl acyltransferase n=1 Tax=Pseudoxanthomonas koreensis TaxID=266061 RepID=UPI001391CF48|nr:lauroyl acyltransferase [Pseudoxanthomonas koreensis]KAF1690295.1 lipid A biosynthesis lauroyl acyltransferase [Pseudoxanthomonas koreensis]